MSNYKLNSHYKHTFLWAVKKLLLGKPWEYRLIRESDEHVSVILDCTGIFMVGPRGSDDKDEFRTPLALGSACFEHDNWDVLKSIWKGEHSACKECGKPNIMGSGKHSLYRLDFCSMKCRKKFNGRARRRRFYEKHGK